MLEEPKINQKSLNLTFEERNTLQDLINDDTIIIKPADKGGAVVLFNTKDYIQEAERQLNQPEHSRKTAYDLTRIFTNKIQATISTLMKKGKLPQNADKSLIHNNVGTSPCYMLPKIHEPKHPGQPIVSGIDSLTDLISQTMDRVLNPLVHKTKSYIKDTKQFLNYIEEIGYLHEVEYLNTIDVGSLYTSIPHTGGVNATTKTLSFLQNLPMEEITTRTLLKLILEHNTFTFNGKFYHQLQGTVMGKKVAPTYANLFMSDLEEKLLEEIPIRATIWKRYIDNIFCIFRCTQDILVTTLNWLNQQHNTIKFTYEYDNNQKLDTKVYKKPTDADM